jgi:hypothetical protein
VACLLHDLSTLCHRELNPTGSVAVGVACLRCTHPPHDPDCLQAGLGPNLMAEGPFTVFAPNDDAFVAAAKKLGMTKVSEAVGCSRAGGGAVCGSRVPAPTALSLSGARLRPAAVHTFADHRCPPGLTQVELLALPNMKEILAYHVVAGNVRSGRWGKGFALSYSREGGEGQGRWMTERATSL